MSHIWAERTDWRDDALCTEVDPDVFFPSSSGVPYLAKQVCLVCPVRQQCLDFAMSTPVEGVWGGTTYAERVDRAKSDGYRYRAQADSDLAIRERRVTELHARGLTDRDMAVSTGLCVDTVRRTRQRLGLPNNRQVSVMPEVDLRRRRERHERQRQARS
jgi:WhiB family redox-sensing transcriptional regulator